MDTNSYPRTAAPQPQPYGRQPAPGDEETFDFSGTFDDAPAVPGAPPAARYEKLMTDFTREFYIPDEDGTDQYAEETEAPPLEMPELAEPAPVPPAGISTKITSALLGVLFISGCIQGGFGTGLFVVAVVILLTALYTITTGRGSWARLSSRKLVAAAIGVAVLLFVLCPVVSPPHRDSDGAKPSDTVQTTPAAKPAPKAKK